MTHNGHPLIWINPEVWRFVSVRLIGKPCRLQVHGEYNVMNNDRIPAKPEMSTGPIGGGLKRRDLLLSGSSLVAASALSAVGLTSPAQAQQPATAPAPAAAGQRPNIVFIMGDDIGWFNIGPYHQGIMARPTPNLDNPPPQALPSPHSPPHPPCTALPPPSTP